MHHLWLISGRWCRLGRIFTHKGKVVGHEWIPTDNDLAQLRS